MKNEYILVTVEGFEDDTPEIRVNKIFEESDQDAYTKLYANFLNSILEKKDDFSCTKFGTRIKDLFYFERFFNECEFSTLQDSYSWKNPMSQEELGGLITEINFDYNKKNSNEYGKELSICLRYNDVFYCCSNVYKITHSIHRITTRLQFD